MARHTQSQLSVKPFGILGGGQLARMLALKCHSLGLPVSIYSESAEDPAAQVVSQWTQGALSDQNKLAAFLKSCSVVTFESEFMDATVLAKISKASGVNLYPSPQLMGALQDRLTQKMLLERHGLPTARFHSVKDEVSARIAFTDLGGSAVFKQRRNGYDGNGTFVVKTEAALNSFIKKNWPIGSQSQLKTKTKTKTGTATDSATATAPTPSFIAESFISFRRETAIILARSRSKDVIRFPFVETFQENSRCLWVKGPLKPNAKLQALGRKLESFMTEIGYVGVLGIELFETPDGYLVNELAPRVHNSGHYTLDATDLDQFSAHILAVVGAHFETPKLLSPGFAMMNLIGQSTQIPSWKIPRSVHLHWYGKSENRVGRKMGHYNVLAKTAGKALAMALRARAQFKV